MNSPTTVTYSPPTIKAERTARWLKRAFIASTDHVPGRIHGIEKRRCVHWKTLLKEAMEENANIAERLAAETVCRENAERDWNAVVGRYDALYLTYHDKRDRVIAVAGGTPHGPTRCSLKEIFPEADYDQETILMTDPDSDAPVPESPAVQ
jgi:hypothetical protein